MIDRTFSCPFFFFYLSTLLPIVCSLKALSVPSLASLFSGSLGGDALSQLFGNFTSPAADGSADGSDASADGQDQQESGIGGGVPGTVDDPAFVPPGKVIFKLPMQICISQRFRFIKLYRYIQLIYLIYIFM
jgi:hypothetical protein